MFSKFIGFLTRVDLFRVVAFVFVLSLFVGNDSLFVVKEGESVIVTRFGKPTRTLLSPGLRVKWPSPIEQLHRIDRRRQVLATSNSAGFTQDKRNIVLTTYIVWRVEDPLRFLQNIGETEAARSSLSSMTMAARNEIVGRQPLSAFVSVNPQDLKVVEMESLLTRRVDAAARERFGIAVDQVGFERISFPEENLKAVLNRMRVERTAEANRLRAEGAKAAQAIRDEAHVRSQEILRKGREEAASVLASAERDAAELAAAAHMANPEFYRFWSELQATARVLREKSTLVLSSNQIFFNALHGPGGSGEGPQQSPKRNESPMPRMSRP